MSEFKWSDSAVLLLIQNYHKYELLWNLKNKDFKDRKKRNDALSDIASTFNTESSEIERKLKNLTSHFFREHRKYEESKKSASGIEEVQLPKWFAYKALYFLKGRYKNKDLLPATNSIDTCASLNSTVQEYTIPPTNTPLKKRAATDGETDEALNLLKDITSQIVQRDDASIFADYIASKLRKMDNHTMSTVQHQIHNIIYEAEMKKFSVNLDITNTENRDASTSQTSPLSVKIEQ